MIILGLDISSFQLNGCLLVDDQAPLLCAASLGRAKEQIDRIDKIGVAMRAIETRIESALIHAGWAGEVEELVIEDAYGFSRKNDKLLWAVIGGCITQGRDIWPRARITVLRTLDWRRELGGLEAKDTKDVGHALVKAIVDPKWGHGTCAQLDEHELDSIGIALAWKHRLENPS